MNRAYTVSLLEGLRNAGYAIDAELEKTYTKYIKEETERLNPKSNDPMAMFMPKIRAGEFLDRKVADFTTDCPAFFDFIRKCEII